MKRTFLFSLFIFAITFLACDSPQQPEFKTLENIKFKSFSMVDGGSVTMQGNAIFHNPNAIGADVSAVDLDVYINGKKVTTVQQDVSASASGNADFSLPLSFKVPLKDVIKDFKFSLNDVFKKKLIEYKLDGHIKVGLGSAQIRVPVTYEGEEELRLK